MFGDFKLCSFLRKAVIFLSHQTYGFGSKLQDKIGKIKYIVNLFDNVIVISTELNEHRIICVKLICGYQWRHGLRVKTRLEYHGDLRMDSFHSEQTPYELLSNNLAST